MEGFWTTSKQFREPFPSERHHVDAKSWEDLAQKSLFVAGAGRKDASENFAQLPTKIFNVTANGFETAQWTYRILCQPLKGLKIPLSRLRVIDDLSKSIHIYLFAYQCIFKYHWDQKKRTTRNPSVLFTNHEGSRNTVRFFRWKNVVFYIYPYFYTWRSGLWAAKRFTHKVDIRYKDDIQNRNRETSVKHKGSSFRSFFTGLIYQTKPVTDKLHNFLQNPVLQGSEISSRCGQIVQLVSNWNHSPRNGTKRTQKNCRKKR